MKTKKLLYLGLIMPFVFWVSMAIAGELHGNYNPFVHTVSELGAIGTNSEGFMAIAMLCCAVMSLFFVIGLWRVCNEMEVSIAPVLATPACAIMFAWTSVFHLGHPLHGVIGMVPLLLFIGSLLSVLLWRSQQLQNLRKLSLLSFLVMALVFLRFVPSFQQHFPGLVQRFFHLGWSIWFVCMAFSFIKLLNTKYNYVPVIND
ncbi:DUF998 domain-containing protein [Pedobacter sp. KR3-3]|uniref:DUF998 domain-containing protein n=1 Tax=Pedobacter albus TaxID=3113905 RepID=A0ABU7ICZ9_9SPHI|nr:DUF998 domain-containing protein [Pedobacter sp. KR3-3]MEE1947049.1 DUF998 domain-containing protein [Pedobacter sp. KR3-3]